MGLSPSDIAAIREAERALADAFESPDRTRWVDSYTEDAIFRGPGGTALDGRAALLAAAPRIDMSSLVIDASSTIGDGDVAATSGRATWVTRSETVRRRFLMVWRRDHGRWRIAREMLDEDVSER